MVLEIGIRHWRFEQVELNAREKYMRHPNRTRIALLFLGLALAALLNASAPASSLSTLHPSTQLQFLSPQTSRHLRKSGDEVAKSAEPEISETPSSHHHTKPHIKVLTLSFKILYTTFAAFFVFLGLAIICDDYLCPAIDIICENLNMSHDIAGATLLAFGSSAPEIFMNVAATASGKGEITLKLI